MWFLGVLVAVSSIYLGMELRDSDAEGAPPTLSSNGPQGPPDRAETPELPDGPLAEGDVSAVSDRILSVADTWMDRQPPAAALDRLSPELSAPLTVIPPTETTRGIESFVDWLEDQGCVADVRIMRATAEGVTAYGMATSYPAQVPVEVDLFVVVADSAETIRTVSLNLPLDSTPHVVPARPWNGQSR